MKTMVLHSYFLPQPLNPSPLTLLYVGGQHPPESENLLFRNWEEVFEGDFAGMNGKISLK